ncbi:c-type cytochrome [Methylobacterium sp. NEAU K]|uniref:c-type cytochrome n=1 Tax=Methylobacterium sp. NEAU K TaxID=3064946 RepID=UPI002733E58B|nr:cytochrome c [Methylobacterium sp. NEAU K]MDP4005626.1 cytochrome c [Methylobacterium sp. NEAU K]
MSMRERVRGLGPTAAALLGLAQLVTPAASQTAAETRLGVGKPVTEVELGAYFSIPPSGKGLPAGHGSAKEGAVVFQEHCAACHGEKLQGNMAPGIGADRLIGGRGSLASETPIKTTESYWPYATTLFDYIKRAMPFSSPGSLTDDQVYAVVAYILSEGHVIKTDETIDATTLPKVRMPNRDGFIPDARPELSLYR